VNIKEELKRQYGLEVQEVIPMNNKTVNELWVVKCNGENFVLKICNLSDKESKAAIHVQRCFFGGLVKVPQVILTLDGNEYITIDGRISFLQEYIQGRQFDPQRDGELDRLVDFIVSVERQLDTCYIENHDTFVFPTSQVYFSSGETILNSLEKLDTQGSLDAEKVIRLRKEHILNGCLEKSKRIMKLIHNDLRPRNIIVTPEDKWVLLDFDFVRVGDLCFDLGSAAMFLTDYQVEKAEVIIQECCRKCASGLTPRRVVSNLLNYFVENNFPFNRENATKSLVEITSAERVKAFTFCDAFLREVSRKKRIVEICGIDGTGKTTLLQLLQERFKGENFHYLRSSETEPYTSYMEEKAKQFGVSRRDLLEPWIRGAVRVLDLYTFFKKQIEPLPEGEVVVIERYTLSSLVYGKYTIGRELPKAYKIYDELEPDLIIFLDVTAEQAFSRICSRGQKKESYEKVEELRKIQRVFMRL